MLQFNLLSVLVITLSLNCINCWVLTDVNYDEVRAQTMDLLNEIDIDGISDEDEADLRKLALIYPGTKWCGAGSIADGYDDLGSSKETDMCCREHDLCPDLIQAGETKHNLTNTSFYTRLNCECDETFRKCLRATNMKSARLIGTIYFNALGTKCYRYDYAYTRCKQLGGWFNKKCVEYEYDTNSEKAYRWYDVPNF